MQWNLYLVFFLATFGGVAHGRLAALDAGEEPVEQRQRARDWHSARTWYTKHWQLAYDEGGQGTTRRGTCTRRKHSAAWFKEQCEAINDRCEMRQSACQKAQDLETAALEQEYRRQKKILDGKVDIHNDAKTAVDEQEDRLDENNVENEDADKLIQENAHCRGELERAKAELATLEAAPNKNPEDIDEECEAKKRVLKWQLCVERVCKAERLQAAKQANSAHLQNELATHESNEENAAKTMTSQERRVASAKAALDAAKDKGPRIEISEIDVECQAERDDLKRIAEADVAAAEEEYNTQTSIFDKREDAHREATNAADERDEAFDKEKEKIDEAHKIQQQNAHCQVELRKATEYLADLEATPNRKPEDIDNECKAKKVILKWEICVREYQEATNVLSQCLQRADGDKMNLQAAEDAQDRAEQAMTAQEKRVAAAKAALDAARANLNAFDCNGPRTSERSTESTDQESAKSGARRAGFTTTFVAGIVLLFVSVFV